MSTPEPIKPMSLATMRRHGVHSLDVTCQHCGHETTVNVDGWPDDAAVPSFGPRMRCTKCGKLGATAVPNWREQQNVRWRR
jgi:rRNA maturation protein Nop10